MECWQIDGFPIGGRLCFKHRKLILPMIDVETFTHPNYNPYDTSFEIDDSRDRRNKILDEANLSFSKSGIRRFLSKLQRDTHILQGKLAETLAPSEDENEFLAIMDKVL
ncbi:unnamed protein product [Rotaria sordida]|uniref:Uncharacterized protein n=1 Tax=Rotaria sordida TaxID=392033 RepID=A0A815R8V9_9BILA|nr:unnamed protein product [Rotaria sordida]CAF1474195.1 unnamed protein product [Rotaria sordida]